MLMKMDAASEKSQKMRQVRFTPFQGADFEIVEYFAYRIGLDLASLGYNWREAESAIERAWRGDPPVEYLAYLASKDADNTSDIPLETHSATTCATASAETETVPANPRSENATCAVHSIPDLNEPSDMELMSSCFVVIPITPSQRERYHGNPDSEQVTEEPEPDVFASAERMARAALRKIKGGHLIWKFSSAWKQIHNIQKDGDQ